MVFDMILRKRKAKGAIKYAFSRTKKDYFVQTT